MNKVGKRHHCYAHFKGVDRPLFIETYSHSNFDLEKITILYIEAFLGTNNSRHDISYPRHFSHYVLQTSIL